MKRVKAIETTYGMCRFRSRLEARWAVFFDALEIQWEYEPEGYKLSSGECYLPDFWLPTFDGGGGCYVEVKPVGGDFGKARRFALEAECKMWLAEGVPAPRAYIVVNGRERWDDPGIPNADSATGENRMFTCPGYEEADLSISEFNQRWLGPHFLAAVRAARSARFGT